MGMMTPVAEKITRLLTGKEEVGASALFKDVDFLLNIRPELRYEDAFTVAKPSGGSRSIRPGGITMKRVQHVLRRWMVTHLPMGHDYSFILRSGVKAACLKHLGSSHAVVYDLAAAFDYVTSDKLQLWLQCYLPGVHSSTIAGIVELLTYQGTTPQGCSATPYAYNLVVRPLDRVLAMRLKPYGMKVVRYSDNICVSSNKAFSYEHVHAIVDRVVEDIGFKLNPQKTKVYSSHPFEFLGVQIRFDSLGLAHETVLEYMRLLDEYGKSSNPEMYRKTVTGMWAWTRHICGRYVPEVLLQSFSNYFEVVGKPPLSFARLLTGQLFEL